MRTVRADGGGPEARATQIRLARGGGGGVYLFAESRSRRHGGARPEFFRPCRTVTHRPVFDAGACGAA